MSKWIFAVILLVVLPGTSVLCGKSKKSEVPRLNTLSLKITTDRCQYELFEPIPIRFEIWNEGNSPVNFFASFILEDHFLRFDITDPSGVRVGFLGGEIKFIPKVDDIITLYPRMFIGQKIDLRGSYKINPVNHGPLYNIATPGRYKITAVYSCPYKEFGGRKLFSHGTIYSNTIEIEVVERR